MLARYLLSIRQKQMLSEGSTAHRHKLSPVPTANITQAFKIALNSKQRMGSTDDVGVVGDYKCLMIEAQRTFEGPF
jgi:hypothetical protein